MATSSSNDAMSGGASGDIGEPLAADTLTPVLAEPNAFQSLGRLASRFVDAQTRWLFFAGVAERAGALVGSVVLARYLGPADMGVLGPIIVASIIGSRLGELGMPFYLQREAARVRDHSIGLLSAAMIWRALTNIILLFAMYAYGARLSRNVAAVALTVGVAAALMGWSQLISAVLVGWLRTREVAAAQLVYRLAYVGLLFSAVLWRRGMIQLLLLTAAAAVVQLLALVLFLKRWIRSRVTFTHGALCQVLVGSWPLSIAGITTIAYDRIDIVIASYFAPAADVGNYYVAYGLFSGALLFGNAFNTVALSRISTTAGISMPRTRAMYREALKRIGIMGVGVAVFVISSASISVRLLYSLSFRRAAVYLVILGMALPLIYANNLALVTLNALRRPKDAMYTNLAGLALNVCLNWAFIPLYGVLAAAIVTVMTEAFVLIIAIAAVAHAFRLPKLADVGGD